LKKPYEFSHENLRSGIILFAWGLFKKVVIADRLALYVDNIFSDVHSYTGIPLLVSVYFYAIQIYCDFSGYSDMALGTAQIFNIKLTQNFNSPYSAASIADFWRRWHISFSRWILDYIFKPLQMQWRGWRTWGTALALIITFFVSGLWHGASWCFIVWGVLHGLYLAASVFYKPIQKKIHKALRLEKTKTLKVWQIFITFHLVCFSWIFFRANSIADAIYVIKNMLLNVPSTLRHLNLSDLLPNGTFNMIDCVIVTAALSILVIKDHSSKFNFYTLPLFARWAFYLILAYSTIFAGVFEHAKYIYAQF
jgi:D-alanyl-lipoteichoic acid acyltransferase DltB (MBOAT superfamily)